MLDNTIEAQITAMEQPSQLIVDKLYYMTSQKARFTCWIYRGNHPNGCILENKSTGSLFYAKPTQIREIPVDDYRHLHIDQPFVELVEDDKPTPVSWEVSNNFLGADQVQQCFETNSKISTDNSTDSIKETPGSSKQFLTYVDCVAIVKSMPHMIDKLALLYPNLVDEFKPKTPEWKKGLKIDGVYCHVHEGRVSELRYPREVGVESTDGIFLDENWLKVSNAISRFSHIQKGLDRLDKTKDSIYTIVVNEEGYLSVIKSNKISSPFIFNNADLANDFLEKNRSTLLGYFTFITEMFVKN